MYGKGKRERGEWKGKETIRIVGICNLADIVEPHADNDLPRAVSHRVWILFLVVSTFSTDVNTLPRSTGSEFEGSDVSLSRERRRNMLESGLLLVSKQGAV